MILHNAVSYQSPGQQHLAALPQFLTQLMTRDSISKQFSHNFDGEGYYLFYVTFVLTGKVVRKARAHTQTFPPGLVAIDTITYTTKKRGQLKAIFSR